MHRTSLRALSAVTFAAFSTHWAATNAYSQQPPSPLDVQQFSNVLPNSTSQTTALGSVAQAQAQIPNQVLPNQTNLSGSQSSAGWNRPITSFIDPRTGIIYDRFIENESVPTMRWETEEKMERRWVPELKTENQQVTQVEYMPVVSYETKVNNGSWWNPFSSQQPATQYVPKVDYVPVNRVVTMPVQVQRYVEREIPVRVPKLVQATESRAKYVDRPRAGQPLSANPAPSLGSNSTPAAPSQTYTTQPIYPSNAYVATNAPQVPYGYSNGSIGIPAQTFSMRSSGTSVAGYPMSPVIAPPANYSAAPTNGQLFATTTAAPLVQLNSLGPSSASSTMPTASFQSQLVPISGTNTTLASNTSQPLLRWPTWLTGNGPLMKTSIFKENRLLPNGQIANNASLASVTPTSVGFAGPVAFAYQQPSTTGGGLQMNRVFNTPVTSSNQSLAGNLTIQPSTATAFPNRTANQTGMPATQLR